MHSHAYVNAFNVIFLNLSRTWGIMPFLFHVIIIVIMPTKFHERDPPSTLTIIHFIGPLPRCSGLGDSEQYCIHFLLSK